MKALVVYKKFKKLLLIVATALLLYSSLGFLILPAILSHQIPKLAQEKLNRVVQIGEIKFNPFSMALTIQDFDIKNLDNSPFIKFEQLDVDINVLQSVFDFSLKMEQVQLKTPYASIKRNKQGDFNFSDLLSPNQEDQQQTDDGGVFPITITKIAISKGKLSWDDDFYSKAQHEEVYPLDLNIEHFTTIVSKKSQLEFSLKLASGGYFNWQGQLALSPLQSTGHIQLSKIDFHKVWQLFIQDSVNFEILSGSELIEADYSLSDTEQGLQFLINNAHLDLFDLKLSEKSHHEVLVNVPDFKLSGISLNLLKKDLKISQLSAHNAQFITWLNADGSINYQSLFASKNTNKTDPKPTKKSTLDQSEPWNIYVKNLNLNNFTFNFTDKTLPTPAEINVTSFNFNARELTNKAHASLPFNLDLKLNNTGDLKVNGHVIAEPFSSQIQADIKHIAIKNFQPYISQFARLDIISGLFNVNATIALLQEDNKPLAISFKGDSQINDLTTRDQISNKDFLNWKQLKLNKIDLDIAANQYAIDTVEIDQPYTRILIRKDKSINVNDIAINHKNQEKPLNSNAKTKNSKSNFKIAHIKINKGSTDFSDMSLILPFSAHINDLKGVVKGISSEQNAEINIALNGRVENLAPVIINGKITPYQGDSEIKLDFKSMPLPLMTPYMAEFAGRKIEKGNMTLGLQYKIINKQLTASNHLLIDQLVLGNKVENPEAVSLPLELAIALLQDTDGKIKLGVPITGNLDNPEFSVSGIIVDALVNVLSKIISSPFTAIASLIDSDEDISQVKFAPGKAALDIKQQNKLNSLVEALAKRPSLQLEIKGTAFSKIDWPYLQAEALDKQIAKMRADELNKTNKKTVPPEYLDHSNKDYQRLLADLFIAKFPQLAERSLFGTPQLIEPETGEFYSVATAKLAKLIPPSNQRLQALAVARAQAISKHLVNQKIAIEKIFLLDIDIDPQNTNNEAASLLNLTVN